MKPAGIGECKHDTSLGVVKATFARACGPVGESPGGVLGADPLDSLTTTARVQLTCFADWMSDVFLKHDFNAGWAGWGIEAFGVGARVSELPSGRCIRAALAGCVCKWSGTTSPKHPVRPAWIEKVSGGQFKVTGFPELSLGCR